MCGVVVVCWVGWGGGGVVVGVEFPKLFNIFLEMGVEVKKMQIYAQHTNN